jgi:hypothetical protein
MTAATTAASLTRAAGLAPSTAIRRWRLALADLYQKKENILENLAPGAEDYSPSSSVYSYGVGTIFYPWEDKNNPRTIKKTFPQLEKLYVQIQALESAFPGWPAGHDPGNWAQPIMGIGILSWGDD